MMEPHLKTALELRILEYLHDAARDITAEAMEYFYDPRRAIADIWTVDDVQEFLPHLNDAQAIEVLRAVHKNLDSEIGINWNVIKLCADALFPTAQG